MFLENFNLESIKQDLFKNKIRNNFVNNFIKELKEYFEFNDKEIEIPSKYREYWTNCNYIEDEIAARIGLSQWNCCYTYRDELSKAVEDSILEISKKEGTLYKLNFPIYNSSTDNGKKVYSVNTFKKGHITIYDKILCNKIPNIYENQDMIFECKSNGRVKIRTDLKNKIINSLSKKLAYLREEQNKVNKEYKKEGHVYIAREDDGYIFLEDISQGRNFVIEDIDFIVDNYDGEAVYKVINGEYTKIVDI